MKTLIYVDTELAVAIAAKLVGLQLQESISGGGGGAFNWLIQASISYEEGRSITRDIRELLPEEVMYEVYEHIDDRFVSIQECIRRMADLGGDRLLPGRPISVQGKLSIPDVKSLGDYDPFSPPDIEVRTFQFHGDKCFAGELCAPGYKLPIYFAEESKAQICFCDERPVEVTGIVRWSPPYSTGGAIPLSLIIRASALWLL